MGESSHPHQHAVNTYHQNQKANGSEGKEYKWSQIVAGEFVVTTKLGGLPVKVSMAPIRKAMEMGINSLAGLLFTLAARLTATGIKMVMVPVELIKPESAATTNMSRTSDRVSLVPATSVTQGISEAGQGLSGREHGARHEAQDH